MSSPESRSDAELAEQLRAGDTAALGELYDRHVRGLYDYLVRFTRDPTAAEDLAQSTFLRAWERRSTLRDPARVRAWLYATAHNLALNHVTRARPATSTDEEGGATARLADSARGPEEAAIAGEAAELVWSAASSLEPRQYAVLDLSVRQGLSTREIADVLDVPVSHAAVLVNRGKDALRNAVRYLLVARRRDHCDRLAALVPAGVRRLTAQQRSAVDHHMRRCADCQDLGARLTAPSELLGALVPVSLPASLADEGRRRLVASVHAAPVTPAPTGPGWPRPRRFWEGRHGWAAGLAVVLLLGGGFGIHQLLRPGGGPPTVQAGGAPGSTSSAGSAVATPPSSRPADSPKPSPSPGSTAAPAVPLSDTGSSSGPAPGASPPATTPPPGTPPPTPAPAPTPVRVTAINVQAVAPPFGLGCTLDQVLQLFTCGFDITVHVPNATGKEVVMVTLTATTPRETQSVTVQARINGTVRVTLNFTKGCPMGTARATTQLPGAKPSNTAPFGFCPLG